MNTKNYYLAFLLYYLFLGENNVASDHDATAVHGLTRPAILNAEVEGIRRR